VALKLGHVSEKGLHYLAKKGVFFGLKCAKLEQCSHCMASKLTIVSLKKNYPSRKSKLLELVHRDVCTPLKVKSFSGALTLLLLLMINLRNYVSIHFGERIKY